MNETIKGALKGLIGLIMISVGFVVYPIVITGAEQVRLANNVSNYTGLTNINGIAPLVVYVMWLFLGALAVFAGGQQIYKGRKGEK